MRNMVYVIDVAVKEERRDFLIARMDAFGLTAVRDEYNPARMDYDMKFEVSNGTKDKVIGFLDEEGFKRWASPKIS